jgi:two-component sensor histidine kinase
MEDELATRIEIVEKLRTQSHEAERELREMQRRYKEQVNGLSSLLNQSCSSIIRLRPSRRSAKLSMITSST